MLKKVLMIATIFTFVGAKGSDTISSFAKAHGLSLPALTLLMEKNPTITTEVLESPTKSVMAQVEREVRNYEKLLGDASRRLQATTDNRKRKKIARHNRSAGARKNLIK